MDRVDLLIDLLKAKGVLTSLEKDILDTYHELHRDPFDMDSVKRQIALNETKYDDLYSKVAALPTTVPKPSSQITDADLRYVLGSHLSILAEKELKMLGVIRST